MYLQIQSHIKYYFYRFSQLTLLYLLFLVYFSPFLLLLFHCMASSSHVFHLCTFWSSFFDQSLNYFLLSLCSHTHMSGVKLGLYFHCTLVITRGLVSLLINTPCHNWNSHKVSFSLGYFLFLFLLPSFFSLYSLFYLQIPCLFHLLRLLMLLFLWYLHQLNWVLEIGLSSSFPLSFSLYSLLPSTATGFHFRMFHSNILPPLTGKLQRNVEERKKNTLSASKIEWLS